MPSKAIRTAAWAVIAAGVAAPLLRRRVKLKPPVVAAAAWSAPVALCVATRRSPARDLGTLVLQMWAYVAMYEMPNDDPEALEARVRVSYPVEIDRAIGLGIPPSLRLQRRLARPGRITPADQVLIWTHWAWFLIPHGTVAYHLWRHRDRFPRAAVLTYAVFDLGVLVYWILPTAPPWYAAREGVLEDARAPELRRMMIEHGEVFWRGNWDRLYGLLGGNPLAAMPSLHFATSVMAAHLLTELGPVEGAIGWTYASTLGVALVYLGEHYVADLLAGLALTEGIRAAAPRAAPAFAAISRTVARLEARAHAP